MRSSSYDRIEIKSFHEYVCVCVCVCVQAHRQCGTVAHQAPLSMEFSKQEYWSGLSFPSSGDLPNPGINPGSPALQADTLPSEPPGKPQFYAYLLHCTGIPMWVSGVESTCHAGDLGSISGWGRSPGGGNDNPLQFSCLGNLMHRRAWQATVRVVAKSWT